jgi:hypothetical protein
MELLRLGARVDKTGTRTDAVEDLVDSVFTPNNNWALLHEFYNAEVNIKLGWRHGAPIFQPFLRVIKAPGQQGEPPLGALRMLLSRYKGLGINVPIESPLVAGIQQREYDAIPVLDFLLGIGAWIDGPLLRYPPSDPTHVPIFAAVEVMATRGDTRLLE